MESFDKDNMFDEECVFDKDNMFDEDYINSFLVFSGARPSYLMQIYDTDVDNFERRKENIRKFFPDLYFFTHYNNCFVSKNKLTEQDVDTTDNLTKILGYENRDESFDDLDRNKPTYTYRFFVESFSEYIELFVYIKQYDKPEYSEYAQCVVNKIKKVFNSSDILKYIITDVYFTVEENIPIRFLISKIVNNEHIGKRCEHRINEFLYNTMGDSYRTFVEHVDYSNPMHRGIVLAYLNIYLHNTLEPFFPLQFSGKMDEVEEKQEKQIDSLVEILTNSF